MNRVVVLDATPLGLLCHPNPRGIAVDCANWSAALVLAGARIIIPEVVDYEVRRELIRARRSRAITLLDELLARYVYLPLDTAMMRRAAELWARSRQRGLPTAGARELDADAILAAQALSLNDPATIVATANPVHLTRYVRCDEWRNIPTA